jgi:DNA helicase-2/ATP-dependent DNA helicase PcrA
MKNRGLLSQLGKGILTDEDISLLSSLLPDRNTIDLEDIPALYYLYILCRGKSYETYDHIIIDEAQDFSPLQFELVRLHSRDGSMTIVGDIAQGIYAHRGISDWDEIERILMTSHLQHEEIIQNYRSTSEIVLFNNEILKKVRKNKALLAEPFERSGKEPRLVKVRDKEAMFATVARDIKSLLSEQISQIGIIAKSSTECDEAISYLKSHGIDAKAISNRDTEYSGGTVVLPVALSKGIEFKAVLVLNANKSTYRGDVAYDGRLLYVASTRALHRLNLYSIGPFSSFLDTASSKAILENV